MFGLGHWEMLVAGLVALLIFGSRLPSAARGMARSVVAFRQGLREVELDDKEQE